MSIDSYLIVGGGIVGLATAYKLLVRVPGARVLLLEKERELGFHQTGHNSGVIHAGLYYKPGSLKARLAVAGAREMTAFCREHGVAHEICGKLVVATDEAEVGRLRALEERGRQNGLQGLRWLEPAAMREIEPHVDGVAALHVPEEGIADYAGVCTALAREIRSRGGEIVTGARVVGLREDAGGWIAETTAGEHAGGFLLCCAGLQADRVARMAGERPGTAIVPFRGEYYRLRPERAGLVRNLVYPVPDPAFPFLGVHFTRHVDGSVEAGPNAVLALSREGYRRRAFALRDAGAALTFPGIWRFALRYRGACWSELRRSWSRRLFAAALQRLVPEIRTDDLAPGGAGVRAQAMARDGALADDFVLLRRERALHVLNAPSPAATASLAIAGEILHAAGVTP